MPSAALTSEGLTPAAAISTSASVGHSRSRRRRSSCVTMPATSLALAASRRLVASTASMPLGASRALSFVSVIILSASGRGPQPCSRCPCRRRTREARRKADDLASFTWRRDLATEILDDAARLLDHHGVRRREHALLEIDRILEADPDMAAREIGLRHHGEGRAPDADRGEGGIAPQQVARIEYRLGRGLEPIGDAEHEGAQHRPRQGAVLEEVMHE